MMTALAAVCFFLAQPLPSEVLAAPAAEPAKEEAPPVEKPRRGPVWPV